MGKLGSASLYKGLEADWQSPQQAFRGQSPVGVRGKPPEAESSVAFEAPAEELNLTLVTDSFCSLYRDVNHKAFGYSLVRIYLFFVF